MKTSAGKWARCAGQTITTTLNGENHWWTYANLVGDAPAITQLHRAEDGFVCQHVLRAVLNVVLDVNACANHIGDQANQIADKMAAAATRQAH